MVEQLLRVVWNQDAGETGPGHQLGPDPDSFCVDCFLLCTTKGFAVYNADPMSEIIRQGLLFCWFFGVVFFFFFFFDGCFADIGGIATGCMLHRSNILALVGGGPSPVEAPHKGVFCFVGVCEWFFFFGFFCCCSLCARPVSKPTSMVRQFSFGTMRLKPLWRASSSASPFSACISV